MINVTCWSWNHSVSAWFSALRQPWRRKGAFWANVCASTWSCLSYLKPSKEKEGELDCVVTPSRSTPFESDPIKLMKLIKLIKLMKLIKLIKLIKYQCQEEYHHISKSSIRNQISPFFSPLPISRDCTSLCHRVLRACQTASHHLTKCLEKMGKKLVLKESWSRSLPKFHYRFPNDSQRFTVCQGFSISTYQCHPMSSHVDVSGCPE